MSRNNGLKSKQGRFRSRVRKHFLSDNNVHWSELPWMSVQCPLPDFFTTKFKVSIKDIVSVDDSALDQKKGLDDHLRPLSALQFHDLKR